MRNIDLIYAWIFNQVLIMYFCTLLICITIFKCNFTEGNATRIWFNSCESMTYIEIFVRLKDFYFFSMNNKSLKEMWKLIVLSLSHLFAININLITKFSISCLFKEYENFAGNMPNFILANIQIHVYICRPYKLCILNALDIIKHSVVHEMKIC